MKKNAIDSLTESQKPKRSRFGKLDIFPRLLCLLLALLLWLTVVNVSNAKENNAGDNSTPKAEQTV